MISGVALTVSGATLSAVRLAKLVRDGRNQYAIAVALPDQWDGLEHYACFAYEQTGCKVKIQDGQCVIPDEALTAGRFTVGIAGVGEDYTYATNLLEFCAQPGADTSGEIPPAPTPSEWEAYILTMESAVNVSTKAAEAAGESATVATEQAEKATVSAESAAESATKAEQSATKASESEGNAEQSAEGASESEVKATQALADLLAMIASGDIPLLVDGKLPLAYIPATATTEVYVVTSADELTSLVAQRGDLAQLVEDVDGVDTITKSWQLLGDDSTVLANWVVWGSSYSVRSAYADTAGEASNANTINNKRIVGMTFDQFDSAVLDDDTFYFVYEDNADD